MTLSLDEHWEAHSYVRTSFLELFAWLKTLEPPRIIRHSIYEED